MEIPAQFCVEINSLWRQRLRWARGGIEVILRHGRRMGAWRQRRMWGVISEYFLSVLWAYTMLFIFVLWGLGLFIDLPTDLKVKSILPSWHGVILALVCLLQFAISMIIDRRYEAKVGRNYYWMIWYPMAYWLLNMFTTVAAVPMTLLKKDSKRATWTSPDRGIR